MKAILIMVFLTATGWAVERGEVERLVKQAAEAEIPQWDPPWGYLEAREKLERMGEEVHGILREMAEDSKLSWQQRLVARIVVERMERGEEIRALQFHNWGQYPEFRGEPDEWKKEKVPGSARVSRMGPVVVRRMKEIGVWYYYIEQNWKTMRTKRECGYTWFASPKDPWPRWCRQALEGQPEEIYLWMAIADAVQKDEHFLKFYEGRRLFWEVIRKKIGQTVPALVAGWDRFLAFEHEDYPGAQPGILELNRKRRSEAHPGFLRAILDFAESEHVDILERFIEQHESELGKYRSELEGVRKRTPQRVEEPPFRCEKRPPLEGKREPPHGFFDPPRPPEPAPEDTPQDVVIEVN